MGKQIEKKISERDIDIEELFQMIRDAVDAKATDTKQKDFLTSLARTCTLDTVNSLVSHKIELTGIDILPKIAGEQNIDVGSQTLPEQSRWHKGHYEHRPVYAKAIITITHPRLSDIWNDVRACAIIAATGAVAAAILSENYATAKGLWYPLFYACCTSRLGDRTAKEVGMDCHREQTYGNWHKV